MKKSIGITPNIETLFGTRDENVRVLEDGLNVTIDLRSNAIELEGAARDVARAEQVFADTKACNAPAIASTMAISTACCACSLRTRPQPCAGWPTLAASARWVAAWCNPRA